MVAKNYAPRVSITCFFHTHFDPAVIWLYGLIKDLLSDENPSLYRETFVREENPSSYRGTLDRYYIEPSYSVGLDAKTSILGFRLLIVKEILGTGSIL